MTDSPNPTPSRPFFNWKIGLLAVFLALILIPAAWFFLSLTRTEFPLEEVPAPAAVEFSGGPRANCLEAPFKDVRQYPQFVSSAPLFGRIDLDSNASDGKSLVSYHFALDESQGTAMGYDRLYFDLNRNLDLTDDKPLAAGKPVPAGPGANIIVSFERIAIPWNSGPPIPLRTLEFVPRLLLDPRHSYAFVTFGYTSVRRGRIRIGGRACEATLVRDEDAANGRYDNPKTVVCAVNPRRFLFFTHGRIFYIHPPERTFHMLASMPHIDGKWYRLSTTPLGDKLMVKLYNGEMGVFQICAGGRSARVAASGYLSTRDTTIFLQTSDEFIPWAERFNIPAGDYCFGSLFFVVGQLQVDFNKNVASDGLPKDLANHPPRYFVEIRKDKPFTFEFPGKFEVLFASPPKDQRFKPGDTVTVKSALLDPVHDLRIRTIRDERPKSLSAASTLLDAEVTIKDSSGSVISQGTMPISDMIYYGFSWQIPADFQPKGGQERITITVTYDTLELFGVIESSREIIIEK